MAKLMTQSEYAKYRNCSRQYISKLIDQGRITLIGDKIDPQQADQEIASTADPMHPKNINTSEKEHYNEVYKKAKTKRMAFEFKSEKLTNEINHGMWIPIREVIQHATATGMTVRDQLANIPQRFAPLLADENQRSVALAELKKELHNIVKQSRSRSQHWLEGHKRGIHS